MKLWSGCVVAAGLILVVFQGADVLAESGAVAVILGMTWLARRWLRTRERQIKRQGGASRCCPQSGIKPRGERRTNNDSPPEIKPSTAKE